MGRFVDIAWLGLAGTPHYLYPSFLQGALRDQIRPGSQIRVRLTVECLKKSDGLGIVIGRRVPFSGGPLRDLQSPQNMLTRLMLELGRNHSGDNSIENWTLLLHQNLLSVWLRLDWIVELNLSFSFAN